MIDLGKCKSLCSELGKHCHNTKNRVIEKMCICDKKDCKILAVFLQCLMVIECLCSYICLCCCEQEVVTPSILTELSVKCTKISHCIGKITSTFDQQMCSYLRCSEIKKLCGDCKALKSKKSVKRTKKTKKKSKGKSLESTVKPMEMINEEPFHISTTNPEAAKLWAEAFADIPDFKKKLTMPLYEGDYRDRNVYKEKTDEKEDRPSKKRRKARSKKR